MLALSVPIRAIESAAFATPLASGELLMRVSRRTWTVGFVAVALLVGCSQPSGRPAAGSASAPAAPAPAASAPGTSGPAGGAPAAGAAAAPAAPRPLDEVRVAAVPGLNMAPYVVAEARGYYAEHGINMVSLDIPSANGVKAAVAGELEVSAAAGSVVVAALNDVAMRLIFVAAPPPLYALYSQPNITSMQELRGKRIGISSRGSGPDVVARYVLQRAGVDPDELTWVVVGSGNARVQALVAGSVESAVLSSPSDVQAKRAGFRELSNFMRELKVGSLAGAGATIDFLQQRPDVARRWLEASIKGLRYMKADRATAIQILGPNWGTDDDLTAEVYDTVIEAFSNDGLVDEEGMRVEIEIGKRGLEIESKDVPTDRVFDLTLTREAARRVDASGWRP
jgi:NitT/TauT family transport system substrate-binding protein